MIEERYWFHASSPIVAHIHVGATPSKDRKIKPQEEETFDVSSEHVDPSYVLYHKSRNKDQQFPKQKNCCKSFPMGKKRTLFSILCALIGLVFTFLSKSTTTFVNLDHAISFGSFFDDVKQLGLIKMNLCRNDSNETSLVTSTQQYQEIQSNNSVQNDRCTRVRIDSYIVGDTLWILPTILIKWVTFTSPIFFALLLFTTFTPRIATTPLFAALLITYFSQVGTLFVLGSKICKTHSCSNGTGMNYSIISSVGWFSSCIFVIMMSVGKRQVVDMDKTTDEESSDDEYNKSEGQASSNTTIDSSL